MKQVFIVHGWDGSPEEGWFPWLKAELEKRGFSVQVPAMPSPSEPRPETWVPYLASAVGKPDVNTYFVGHSIGCQTIMRYLETLPAGVRVGGAVFVAGWLKLTDSLSDLEKKIAQPWLTTPIDFKKIRSILPRTSAIFSPTDTWVIPENEQLFKDNFGAQIVRVACPGGNGHFSGSDGVTELPEALAAILRIAAPTVMSIDDFAKMEIRMGKILKAEPIIGADKLLKLEIDLGEGSPRTICSGIAQFYKTEELIGKLVPVVTNLAPRKIRGVESNGMVLFGIDETGGGHAPIMLNPVKDLPPGSPVQ
ncbi:MAG: alpha/beta fold hydrolase [bacterium]|nr:alpha/beta fold hydrolase [bacterium]